MGISNFDYFLLFVSSFVLVGALTPLMRRIAIKNEVFDSVRIGKHVIVGAGSVIMPGTEVAEGCSIGSMTLVNKSTLPWGIYVGIPARRVNERKQNMLELEKQFLLEIDNGSI